MFRERLSGGRRKLRDVIRDGRTLERNKLWKMIQEDELENNMMGRGNIQHLYFYYSDCHYYDDYK